MPLKDFKNKLASRKFITRKRQDKSYSKPRTRNNFGGVNKNTLLSKEANVPAIKVTNTINTIEIMVLWKERKRLVETLTGHYAS